VIAEGWITEIEIELVSKYMNKDSGSILEVGAANGRMFSYLYNLHPNWKYYAVDPWEQEQVRLQIDWNKDYFEKDNLKEIITKEMFVKNCPYAETYEMYFENFYSEQKFDIISLGLISKNIDWTAVYDKAYNMLSTSGVIVGRNFNHKKYGDDIKKAVSSFKVIDQCKGSFVIRK